MNQETYKTELERIYNETHKLAQDRIKLKDDYVLEHSDFEIGEKVRVITRQSENFGKITPEKIELGFISSRYVDDKGLIKYEVNKVKKDGSQSSHKLYVWYNNRIEKL